MTIPRRIPKIRAFQISYAISGTFPILTIQPFWQRNKPFFRLPIPN
nr:hypothetical protein [uncultured Kingella sp.]